MIDLDAARAARREASGKGPVVKFDGEEFELAPEIPFEVIEGLALIEDGDSSKGLIQVARGLFGDHYERIVSEGRLSINDLNEVMPAMLEEYGLSAPLPSDAS